MKFGESVCHLFLECFFAFLLTRSYFVFADSSFVSAEDVTTLILSLMDRFTQGPPGGERLPRERVFNVGGPRGLSRLQVAQILAAKLGTELVIQDSNNNSSSTLPGPAVGGSVDGTAAPTGGAQWVVRSVASGDPPQQSAALVSPRDITMDVSQTEAILGIKFRPLEEYILDCLKPDA